MVQHLKVLVLIFGIQKKILHKKSKFRSRIEIWLDPATRGPHSHLVAVGGIEVNLSLCPIFGVIGANPSLPLLCPLHQLHPCPAVLCQNLICAFFLASVLVPHAVPKLEGRECAE
jgi:hypothetical protein